ncbi:hypothetical protein SAMN05444487_101355 [Marininema mesophilum]|uniref:Uncharacterized protein n=1 Tax=Marininema mesophilum TaxID=1048340 RepID=A0A1H2R2R3_9BACL|nr:hypothetical protein [Marininema mesophilum]SDW13164.1 hypothetical protein SAMN05444487_101355 [Marininema mesophilum]
MDRYERIYPLLRCVFIGLIILLLGPYNILLPRPSFASAPPIPLTASSSTIVGDYAGEIRESQPRRDGLRHVDTTRTIRKLKELGINTYFYLIWHQSSDWDDLRKEFLPAAQKAGITVWVYLVPPSEARDIQSEPFGTDFIAWFRAVGSVSHRLKNLKGIVIDDFNHNLSFFNPSYVQRMKAAGKALNPHLKFVPQIYYTAIQPATLQRYRKMMDGVLMTFRDGQYRNTQRTQYLRKQIQGASQILSSMRLPFYLMVHASKLSATPASPSVRYVKEALGIGMENLAAGKIQGLVTYVLYKDWFAEQREKTAHSGYGYASVFVPPGRNPLPGVNGEFKQLIYPHSTRNYRLSFSHMDVYPYGVRKGEYWKQVLIDGKTVWQQDVTKGWFNRWQTQELNLSSFLKGKKEAVISLRLQRKHAGSRSWLYVGFDSLIPHGFSLENARFEKKGGWSTFSNHPSMIANTLLYDPKRRLRVYLAAMTLNTAYHLLDDARQSGNASLAASGEKILNHLTKDRTKSVQRELDNCFQLIEKEKENLSIPLHKHMVTQAKRLDRLLHIPS